jgi:hypothetical protein
MTNYIYLLKDGDVCKVGRTTQHNLNRLRQYPKNVILLFQIVCNNCMDAEKRILRQFKNKFEQRLEHGIEYFSGDYKVMIDIIYSIVTMDYDLLRLDNQLSEIKEEIKIPKNIQKLFPYELDEVTGGKQKFIMINEKHGTYQISYLKYDRTLQIGVLHIERRSYEFIREMIAEQCIVLDHVYDLDVLLESVSKFKIQIIVEEKFCYKIEPPSSFDKMRQLFCDILINGCIYASTHSDREDVLNLYNSELGQLSVDIGTKTPIVITLIKFNHKFYDFASYVYKYAPYIIRVDQNNNYYFLNYDKEYIGGIVPDVKIKEDFYLYDQSCTPWANKTNIIAITHKYKKIVTEYRLNRALNPCAQIDNVISFCVLKD